LHPLHLAIQAGNHGATTLLLGAGANPSIQNKKGFTPLHIAVCLGTHELLNNFLDAGQFIPYIEFTQKRLASWPRGHEERQESKPVTNRDGVEGAVYTRRIASPSSIVRSLLSYKSDLSLQAGLFSETPAQMASTRPGTSFKIIKMFMEAGEAVMPSYKMSLYRWPWFEFLPIRLHEKMFSKSIVRPSHVSVLFDMLLFPGNLYTWAAASKLGQTIDFQSSDLIPPQLYPVLQCDGLVHNIVGRSISVYNETMALVVYRNVSQVALDESKYWIGKLWICEGYGLSKGVEGHEEVIRVIPDHSKELIEALDTMWRKASGSCTSIDQPDVK
jgi:hypothetical protein